MRKLFTTLKSVVAAALVVSMVGVTSCSYDDTDVKNRLDDVEQGLDEVKGDLATLEARVADLEKKVADEVDALKGLIKKQVVVTSVVEENGGITVTLSDGNEFTVYPKTVDTDTDTDTYISVKADETTGVYYWAIFNKDGFVKYLTVGVSEERVPVFQEQEDTCEPIDLKFQVNEATGTIEFSVDGGKTWTDSGVEVGACDCEGTVVSTGACIFKNVVVRDHYVTFTLANGQEIVVSLAEEITFEAGRTHFYVKPGEVKTLPFVVNEQVEDISVMNQPMGWKASVEVDEDQSAVVEPAENAYILTIEGPSQERIDAGIADKTGFIQLHITTAAGACKVAKVAVDLAELSLTVDAEGNITVTNTLVATFTDYEAGEQVEVTDFTRYYIGAVQYDLFSEDWEETMSNGDCAAIINNNTYYRDGFYAEDGVSKYVATGYEDGVCEVNVMKTSIAAVLDTYYIDYLDTESYVVFVIPLDMKTGASLYDEAQVVELKKLKVAVNVVEPTFNNVYFDVILRGASEFRFCPVPAAYATDDYFAEQLYYMPYGYGLFGIYAIPELKDENIDLNSLLNYGADEIVEFTLYPDTEYVLAILAVEEGQTEFTVEDLHYVEFKTAALVEAATPANYTIKDREDMSYTKIAVDVTVPENTAAIYHAWYGGEGNEMPEESELVNSVIAYGDYPITDFDEGYTIPFVKDVDKAGDERTLVLVIVDQDGNYTLVKENLTSKAVVINPANVTIENVEFLEEGGVANITVGGVEGLEVTAYKAYVISTNGYGFAQRTEEELANLAYADSGFYKSYDTNPFNVARTADSKSVAIKGDTYKVAVAVVFADGSFSKTIYKEIAFTDDSGSSDVTVVSAVAGAHVNANGNTFSGETLVTFTMSDNSTFGIAFKTGDNNYLTPGTWQGNSWQVPNYITYIYKNGETINSYLEVEVSYADGAYTIGAFQSSQWYTGVAENFPGYTGTIEGLDAPADTSEPEPEVPGNATELTISSHFTVYSTTGEHELGFYYDETNGKYVDIDFLAYPITAGTYTLTNGLSGMYTTSHGGNIEDITVVVTDNSDGTLTFDATFKGGDGNWYHFTYTAQIYS